ncbi:Leo1-domain-containing protein [Jaminaea rosea]|uniref:Leo1-domain-containing protein n=1 Tax=Jaminaea rosea TaxID=1569628 RepID=A0A316UZ54_9BASI|nr:Leo1-domain-containing protein [Jaminaea rosea]PWN30492.1 Leo1-domain-containing protein [Jaminaea rosea]
MSASPAAAAAASPLPEAREGSNGDAEMASVAASPAAGEAPQDADDDDLFGDDDDDDAPVSAAKSSAGKAANDDDEEDEDDDEDDIRPSNRRRRKAVASQSPARGDTDANQSSALPTFEDDEAIEADGDDDGASEAARLALEYTEDGQPMGQALDGRSPSPLASRLVASVALANTAQRFTPHHLARLPLFLRVEPKAFDEESFKEKRREENEAEAEAGNADERLRDVERRLRCENTVRWKVGEDGKRRSNARFVRWNDGSWTLQVGKEHFDIAGMETRFAPGGQDASTATDGVTGSQSQSQSQGNARRGGSKHGTQQPLTYLATPDAESGVFQTLTPLHSNISVQPTSLQSATHRLISQSLSSIRAREGASKVTMSDLVAGERAPEEVKREAERRLLEAERKKRLRKKKERGER